MKIKRLGLLTALAATGLFAAACAETGTNTARNASPAVNASPAANTNTKPVAPAASPAALNIPFPDVERMPLAEAKKAFDDGSAVFVDTHSAASFDVQRIKGAVNIPPDQIAKADSLPKGKKIIAYCS
ncbi:MAG: rhodanese-like domain-containing protein [Acidobacteria bacterium]|nr:rhodanese-like domain-containing protein [Acidobacteriota bacterium]